MQNKNLVNKGASRRLSYVAFLQPYWCQIIWGVLPFLFLLSFCAVVHKDFKNKKQSLTDKSDWQVESLAGLALLPDLYTLSKPSSIASLTSKQELRKKNSHVNLAPLLKNEDLDKEQSHDQGSKIVQIGSASWYGRSFHGRRTANGERYDMHQMTAAHLSFPFGSKVCVRDLRSGREVLVRINDRGPFVKKRIIDLSYASARRLGMLAQGVKKVVLWLPSKETLASCGTNLADLSGFQQSLESYNDTK